MPFQLLMIEMVFSDKPSSRKQLVDITWIKNLTTDRTRNLGLVVCRGTQVALMSPSDGMEEIANPFLEGDEEIEVTEG